MELAELNVAATKSKHEQYADGLRAIADWYEAHQDIPLPSGGIEVYSVHTKEEAANVIRSLGRCEKKYDSTFFYVIGEFGPISLKFSWYRSEVCERRVVGKKLVPAHYTPEREEEIVEWDCHPILQPSAETEDPQS